MQEGPKWTDVAVVVLTVGIVIVSALQWYEMHTGSADTHQLAVDAKTQAEASKALAEAAKTTSSETHSLAEAAKSQADSTRKVADQTLAEVKATNSLARETHKTFEMSAKQLEVTQRPWITAKLSVGRDGLSFTKDQKWSLDGVVVLKNVGHSPAVAISTMYAVVALSAVDIFDEPTGAIRVQRLICDEVRRDPTVVADVPRVNTLFPGDETTPLQVESVTRYSFDVDALKLSMGSYVSLVVVGCVDYRFTFAPEHHQTGFIYRLYGGDPAELYEHRMIKVGENLPPEKLQLIEYFFGGKYAD
jgi:hypothetical protein